MKHQNKHQALLSISAGAEAAGRRLDHYLAETRTELSRSRIQKLIEAGLVAVNKEPCTDKNYRLQPGDEIAVNVPEPVKSSIGPEQIPLDIIYEDKDLLVVNKPRGMVVHPAPGHAQGTLVNALLNHCSDLSGVGGVARPGIVHRLDKDTSGLLIVAKNDFAHHSLSAQLKSRKLRREYLALVFGLVKPKQGRIEAPVGRHPRHRKKMAVTAGGRTAVTHYRVIKYYDHHSLLRLKLETGRTHQIRVHLAHIGYPVVGDPVYSRSGSGDLPPHLAQPQALHALSLSFSHPRSGNVLKFSSPLPEAFIKTLIWLKNNN